ncbi:hypothetical protein [Jiangella anatolica]|uniref:DUF4386 domain-containing protein n=1 Tax=Jiangella anatolica TaxID=2670374 RepID=A0A2W2BLF3_9ACTN|nr:hypothetical protein [Jiangella anatolica]PZF81144.1 hypothetical protein C1I92_22485 [Jiangella anatolica]
MSTTTLRRLGGLAGILCGLALCFNAARRGDVIPTTQFTRSLAPLAQLFGLFLLTTLYVRVRAAAGRIGLVGYVLNFAGLAGLVGAEYIVNFVFPYLSDDEVQRFVDGHAGTMFTVTQVVFLTGVLVFVVALLRSRLVPAAGVLLYAIGSVPIGLRGVLPDVTLYPGLVLAAAGAAWLGWSLWSADERQPAAAY